MQKLSFIIFILFSFSFQSYSQEMWNVFKSVDGKFQILSPGEMTKKENEIKTEIGELNYVTFIYQPEEKDADNFVYLVSYCDYPNESIHSDSLDFVKEFFQTTIDSSVESVGGELKYSSDVSIDNYPGVLWRVDYNEDSAMIKTKAFVVKNRFYSIQVVSLKDKGLNLYVDKFLDSFTLL